MFYKSQQGQGLLEAVMATAIIATGLSGVMALTAGNIKSTGISAEQVIAVNLAREGIEVVHHLRDSNWLAGDSIETGLVAVNDATAILEFDETAGVWSLDWTPVDFDDPETVMYRNITAGDYEGLYRQDTDSLLGLGYQVTNFKRLIYTYRICDDRTDEYQIVTCQPLANLVGIRVVSEVQWTERGNIRSIIIEERLFDWK